MSFAYQIISISLKINVLWKNQYFRSPWHATCCFWFGIVLKCVGGYYSVFSNRTDEVSLEVKSPEENHSDEKLDKEQLASLAAIRKAHIFNVLQMCGGSRAQAAKILGLSERELRRQMKTLGIACVNGDKKKGAKRDRLQQGEHTNE